MRNKSTAKNKKGAVTSSIADFWAYVMFVFVIVLFYAFFNSQSKDIEANRIQSAQGRISSDLELINYLKTPHTLDGSAMAISDMIVMYYNEKDTAKKKHYYEEILKKTKEIFNPFEHCTVPEGISDKIIEGYAVYILDEESYSNPTELNKNYGGTALKSDMKFRSDHFFDGRVKEKSLGVIPNAIPNGAIHVGLFISSVNTFGMETRGVSGC